MRICRHWTHVVVASVAALVLLGSLAAPAASVPASLDETALTSSSAPTSAPAPAPATTPSTAPSERVATLSSDAASATPPMPAGGEPGAAAGLGPPAPPVRMINSDAPDPTVVRSGSSLYAYTTNINLFGTWYNTPVWSSITDGAIWTLERDALPGPGSWTEGQGFVWAPGVIQVADGTWNLYYAARLLGSTADPRYQGDGMQCIGVATAPSAVGPFTSRPTAFGPLVCQRDLGGSVDPKPIYGPDGGLRLLYKSDENAPFLNQNSRLWSSRLDGSGLAQAASPSLLLMRDQPWENPTIENPAMVQAGGRWWMTYAGGWWASSSYAVGLASCAGPDGPCAKVSASPWLASGDGIAGPGGADFYRTSDSRLFMVYAGWDPAAIGDYAGSRYAFGQRVAASPWGLAISSPFGYVDTVADASPAGSTTGAITATGWAIDPDTNDSIVAEVSVDGASAVSSVASTDRPDVTSPSAWAGYGPNHGFSATVPASSGLHNVCVHALNVAAGSDSLLGCRSVTVVAGRPFGAIDAATGSAGSIRVVGTAADPDTPIDSTRVHVSLDGADAATVSGSVQRNDFAAAYPGYGAFHGFDVALSASAGWHQVCVTAENVGQGVDVSLGCLMVTVLGPSGRFTPLDNPTRILDSRTGVGGYASKWPADTVRDVTVAGLAGVPADATAVVMNVTVTEPEAPGYVTVFPSGQMRPLASNLNYVAGQTVPNLVTVAVGAGGRVSLYSAARMHLVVDVVGYYRPGSGQAFVAVMPVRALDSRYGPQYTTRWTADSTRDVALGGAYGVLAGATAVVMNITVTDTDGPGFLTAFPSGQQVPLASNLNYLEGQTIPNLTIDHLGVAGRVSLRLGVGGANVVGDVSGYFIDEADNHP
jgi:hypothetical protein